MARPGMGRPSKKNSGRIGIADRYQDGEAVNGRRLKMI
jgi:hypothetical protein